MFFSSLFVIGFESGPENVGDRHTQSCHPQAVSCFSCFIYIIDSGKKLIFFFCGLWEREENGPVISGDKEKFKKKRNLTSDFAD
jgi:hypothetical protein